MSLRLLLDAAEVEWGDLADRQDMLIHLARLRGDKGAYVPPSVELAESLYGDE